ncbi:MAG: Rieske 2Fe-2S domain-containing protein [Campylobacter sp.]|nr:Rieske 2Fe-2S domain-containing protein [Campylobacter sp.]MBQ3674470.1 Rieske 2Fe-2S domain-containing protein [Campylobacter sp.]MBQ7270089.1 Rieske 2Fe-2S domain-containing protein [Campylobacter sp.]MBQ7675277.1 Rieske 2Fe-2S domain-containing protein [Campylobacter sp.]MBQ9291691.1 Rieske 2Fe-2S domain-containing protein [Campylobacter sp.]
MSVKFKERRDFIGLAFGATAAVGGILALGGLKKSWDPLPSVRAAGFTTIDLGGVKEGELYVTQWRKKPIFVLKKTAQMEANEKRDIVVDGARYIVCIGLCTHLGCIPSYNPSKQLFVCACHGGQFNASGENVFGPPPRPLDIPPFKIEGTKIVLGEEGPEYKALMQA